MSCLWFENYLSDKTQIMISDGVKSSFLDITRGVSQGSVLEPVRFTTYINSLLKAMLELQCDFVALEKALFVF